MREVHKDIEDVVEQILSTLPPKSLMRFKCVSKRWYALITDPRFVAKHFSISKQNNRCTPCVLLKRLLHEDNNGDQTQKVFSLLKFRNNVDIDIDNDGGDDEHSFVSGVEDIDIPPCLSLKTQGSSLHIVGHCNGIVCLVAALSGEVILWNPAIHDFKLLPLQPYLPDSPEIVGSPLPGWPKDVPISIHRDYMDNLGFGFDPRSNDYKVVNIGFPGVEHPADGYNINLPPKTAIYTLSSNSWREMKTFSLETQSTILLPDRFQVYFKGMCYWLGRELHKEILLFDAMTDEFIRNIIILFDMADEVFHDMLLPDSLYDPNVLCFNMRLLVWNESVALFGMRNGNSFSGSSFGIWVMDDFDGPKSRWTKHISFDLIEKPLAFLKSDEILMADTKDTKGRIFSYNLSTKRLKYLPIESMQDDSATVVYDNYSIVSILGGNELKNTDRYTNAGSSLLEHSSFPSSIIDNEWHSYSVWAILPDDVCLKVRKVIQGLRSEFGGPEIEPHITVVGSIRMTHAEVLNKFRSLQSCVPSGYKAIVNRLLWRATGFCGSCFGFQSGVRPHLSLLYGNLTEEERTRAQEKVSILDESITRMSFPITKLALYKIDYKDKSLKSWEKIAEYNLRYHN
ncbi:PREDICTED: F-box/kelch-repeat protein At3g06240-like [Fragaria vesca subsp. vesca]